jgi:hypothetical protein
MSDDGAQDAPWPPDGLPLAQAFWRVVDRRPVFPLTDSAILNRFSEIMVSGRYRGRGCRGSSTADLADIPATAWPLLLLNLMNESQLIERPTKIVWYNVYIYPGGAAPLALKPVPPPRAIKTQKEWLNEAWARFPKGPDERVIEYCERLGAEAKREGLDFKAQTIRVRYHEHVRGEKATRSKKG